MDTDVLLKSGGNIQTKTVVKYLRRENGLPSSQIQDLKQDKAGRIWAATPSGLASYDGSRVRTYSKKHGLRSHGLRALGISPDGRLWIGSDQGFDTALDGVIESSANGDEDWPYGLVDCIHSTKDANWLGTASGLIKHTQQGFSHADHEQLKNGQINALATSSDGTLWAAPANGDLLFLADNKWQRPGSCEWQSAGRIRCLTGTADNRVVLGGEFGFVEISRSGNVVASNIVDGGNGENVLALLYTNDELWVAEGEALRVYRRFAASWEIERTVLTQRIINSLLVDNFSNIWIATESHGIAKISALEKSIQHISLGDEHAIFAIRSGRNPQEIIVAGNRKYRVLDTERNNKICETIELGNSQIWDVLIKSDGSVLAATSNGLFYRHKSKTIQLGADDAILSRPNRCLAEHNGRIFVGTLGGCVVVNRDLSVLEIAVKNNEELGYVYTLKKDNGGVLWAGTLGNGLWRLQRNIWCRVEHELLNRNGNTYALDVRDDNRIAFVQDNKVFLILPDNEIKLLLESDEPIAGWTIKWSPSGSIWTGSASGLNEYNSEDGRRQRQIIALLDLSDWEFTTSRSLHVHDNGSLYCGVNSGLVFVNTEKIDQLSDTPTIKFGGVNWEQVEPARANGTFVVPVGRWSVSIDVFTCWYIDEDDLYFRFRLLGFDDHWRELTQSATISFNSLPPGEYQLEAQAFNRLVGYGPVSNIFSLKVLKPNWLSMLFAAPASKLLELGRARKALQRNRTLNEKNQDLERLVQERTADMEQTKIRLEAVNKELTNQATSDSLTGVSNRRYFDAKLLEALTTASKTGSTVSLILMDIDYFKPFNDIYGHTRGDECLSFIARKLAASLYRPADFVARYGGEEFVILLSDVTVGGAMSLAERLRRGIEDLGLKHEGAPETGLVTGSFGVTTLTNSPGFEVNGDTARRFIDSADAALYEAKDNGRNQCIYKEAPVFPNAMSMRRSE